ncbi:MAG: glutathione-disulfide reductase [Pseudomonadota bacterium]|nr:glutathione-disulfide reductase [Pseudomonadota bacterium]
MASYDYDLFVIGAGSGGVRAARMSAKYGARVAIAEEYRVGGTCVIRGCVPKKLFVYASRFGSDFEDAAGFGWTVADPGFDWPTLVANKDREIDRLNAAYTRNLNASGVEIILDRATLEEAHTVRLEKAGRAVTARYVLIATGGTPFVPDIEGREHVITSNEAFHLKTLPGHMVIVGAGYIALEFASIFNGLGVDVTVIYRGEQILRGFDDEIRGALATAMRARGVDIRVKIDVKTVDKKGKGFSVKLSDGDQIETGLVMYATGRVPDTEGIGLQQLGVECGWNGHVVVDEYSRTSIENIYAVGDVTDRVALTPVAIREGAAFAETVFNGNPTPVDHDFIPTAVFSQPEIGTVGLTEEQAREKHPALDIYKSRFRPMKYTLAGREEQMLMKLLVDGSSKRVVGCHILGPDAAEIVQMVAVAMRMGATKADFDATMALHPSAAEELVTMRDKWEPPVVEASQTARKVT